MLHSCRILCEQMLDYKGIMINGRHCGASEIEYTCRTLNSYMHLTVIRMWLSLRPQKITKYAHVYTGTVSQAWLY